MRKNALKIQKILVYTCAIVTALALTSCRSSFNKASLKRGFVSSIFSSSSSNLNIQKITSINPYTDDIANGSATINGVLYFFANTGKGGKLFSYDTTVSTTPKQRSNTNPYGSDRSWNHGMHVVNNVLYFTAYDANGRVKFYKFDPAVDTMVTAPFVEINTTQTGSIIPAQISTNVFPQTSPIQKGDDIGYPTQFHPVAIGTKIYFTAYNGTKSEIYEYDPAVPGFATAISNVGVADNGDYSSAPLIFGVVAGNLRYGTDDGSGMNQYNTYDYTLGGATVGIGSTDVGGVDLRLSLPTALNVAGIYYFASHGENGNHNLYSYVPGDTSITQLSDTSGGGDDMVGDMYESAGVIYFSALDNTATRNIFTYTTGSGIVTTTPISDPCGGICSSVRAPIGKFAGKFYFNGFDANGNLKFYKTTLGSPGTTVASFSINNYGDDQPANLTNISGTLFFTAFKGTVIYDYEGNQTVKGAYKVYKYEPETATTTVISNTSGSAVQTDDPQNFTVANETLYFTALDAAGFRKLYRYTKNVDTLATTPLTNLMVGGDDSFWNFTAVGSDIYFNSYDNNGVGKLYFKALTDTGVTHATDAITDTAGVGFGDNVSSITPVINTVYFTANDTAAVMRLYKYTPGDALVTAAITNIATAGETLNYFTVVKNELYFTAVDDAGVTKLYKDRDTDTNLITAADAITNTGGGVSNDAVTRVYTVGGRVYFIAADDTGSYHYYSYTSGAPTIQPTEFYQGTPPMVPDTDYSHGQYIDIQGYRFVKNIEKSFLENIVLNFTSGLTDFFHLMISPVTSIEVVAAPVEYVKMPINLQTVGGGPVQYIKINPNSGPGPFQYVKRCTLYGSGKKMNLNGVSYFLGAYTPGTSSCSILSMAPGDNTVTSPFPDFGREQSQFGTDGSWGLWGEPTHSSIFFTLGLIRPTHSIVTTKLYKYSMGTITPITDHAGGNEYPSGVTIIGKKMYYTIDTCGGREAHSENAAFYSCRHIYSSDL